MHIAAWKKQLPMWATLSRLVGVPVVGVLLWKDMNAWAAFAFTAFAVTDFLDRYWARKYKVTSALGSMLDTATDKILVLSSLVFLLWLDRLDPIIVVVILARDVYMGSLRAAASVNGVLISARPLGKYKTALQLLSVIGLCAHYNFLLTQISYYTLWASTALAMISAYEYTRSYTLRVFVG